MTKGRGVLRRLESILTTLFWVLLLLGFNAPPLAMMTVLCAAMHEGGHLVALWCVGRRARLPIARPNGFLLPTDRPLSYRAEALVLAAGPLVNLLTAALFLLLQPLGRAFFRTFACVSLLTGLANLLPLGGYDGQRLVYIALCLFRDSACAEAVCRKLTFATSATLSFLSLYLIWRTDAGYWLFGVFFAALLSEMHTRLGRGRRLRRHFWRKKEKTEEFESNREKNAVFPPLNRG